MSDSIHVPTTASLRLHHLGTSQLECRLNWLSRNRRSHSRKALQIAESTVISSGGSGLSSVVQSVELPSKSVDSIVGRLNTGSLSSYAPAGRCFYTEWLGSTSTTVIFRLSSGTCHYPKVDNAASTADGKDPADVDRCHP